MKRYLHFITVILLLSASAYSQQKTVTYLYDPGASMLEKTIDIRHLKAALRIDPFDQHVTGSVVFYFSPVRINPDSIVFWSPDIDFSDVTIPGIMTSFRKTGDYLVIYLPSGDELLRSAEYEIRMDYDSRPGYDLFFIGWNEPALRDNKQVWAHRPFHWLPYINDRLTVDMYITFDGNYQVFSNGVRESVTENTDGTKTWHYKMHREHPFFSTALVIGDYKYIETETSGSIPLELWYYSWQEDHAEPTYRYSAEMFDFFHDEFGLAYPYELYRQAPVTDYLYGAMETTTSTVFGDYLAVNERAFDGRNYVNVNAHELVHQWYGNCLSHLRGADVWLTESFATYYAKMFEKEVFGEEYYQDVRRQEFEETLDASKTDGFPVGHSRGGRARWYPKGSLVMDMLRDVLGEEDFKAAIRHYTNKNAFSEVETGEFLSAIYEATGKPMDWFFEQWIFRGGEPKYEISWHRDKSPEGIGQVVIRVEQVHDRNDLIGLFKMPIWFEVHYADGSSEKVQQWIGREQEEVVISNPADKEISFVLFDPGRRILKSAVFKKSLEEWKAQALYAPDIIDRYDALVALRDFPSENKLKTLQQAWNRETFHLTRGEILKQAGPQNLAGWENNPDPLLRRAAIEAVDRIPPALQKAYEGFLFDHSYINIEKALEILCRSFPEKTGEYLEATNQEKGWRGLNIRMKWLEIAIMSGREEYLAELIEYAGPRFEFETRINAFNVLRRLNYLDEKSAIYLVDGARYWNYKVSHAAKEVLAYFTQQNRYKELLSNIGYR